MGIIHCTEMELLAASKPYLWQVPNLETYCFFKDKIQNPTGSPWKNAIVIEKGVTFRNNYRNRKNTLVMYRIENRHINAKKIYRRQNEEGKIRTELRSLNNLVPMPIAEDKYVTRHQKDLKSLQDICQNLHVTEKVCQPLLLSSCSLLVVLILFSSRVQINAPIYFITS